MIRQSSGRDIDGLIADLAAASPLKRETAVARLIVIGARAIERLTAFVESGAPSTSRAAALRALEGIANPRALPAILASTADPDNTVATAAISAAIEFLKGVHSAEVTDRLTRIALDGGRPRDIRLAAIDGLSDLKSATLKPLWKAIVDDPDSEIRARAEGAIGRIGKPR